MVLLEQRSDLEAGHGLLFSGSPRRERSQRTPAPPRHDSPRSSPAPGSRPSPRRNRADGDGVRRDDLACAASRNVSRRKVALHPIELDLGPGGIVGLLGPNGSGKSTLLRLLTGLVPRDSGDAWVDGEALAGDGTAVRERVSYAPGELALYGELSGREHLAWFLRGRDAGALGRARAGVTGAPGPLGATRARVQPRDETPAPARGRARARRVLALLQEDVAAGG
ncbi:MAG: ATP-binding cassette domain-containing protein [Planctomycetes bacterium]|nr:ATP-binding cassette domain-containing protein [Planctomycetota bacterium]